MELRQEVLKEMVLLRERTADVKGSVASTIDGLTIACDLAEDSSEHVSALAAALLAMSRRMMILAGRGDLEETLVSGSAGHAAFYAAAPLSSSQSWLSPAPTSGCSGWRGARPPPRWRRWQQARSDHS
ncbi:roadblock/LC7 domain-containing protein [Nonomuraea ferruginea]